MENRGEGVIIMSIKRDQIGAEETNDNIKEQILDDIGSMTVDEFQNALEKHGLTTESAVVDEYVGFLAEKMFEERLR